MKFFIINQANWHLPGTTSDLFPFSWHGSWHVFAVLSMHYNYLFKYFYFMLLQASKKQIIEQIYRQLIWCLMEIIVCKCPALWEHQVKLLQGIIHSSWDFSLWVLRTQSLSPFLFFERQLNKQNCVNDTESSHEFFLARKKKNKWQKFDILIWEAIVQNLSWMINNGNNSGTWYV